MKQVAFLMAIVMVAGCATGEAATERAPQTVWLVGDSISVSARSALEEAIPGIVVDAAEGRQFSAAPSILGVLLESGPLPDVVVVALGTNGPVDPGDMDAVMDLADGAAVAFVNVRVPRPWEQVSNAEFERAEAAYGASVIDWKAVADADPGLLRNDGYHLSAGGVDTWVDIVATALGV